MRFAEIGQQLRAYRMESGLRAEEIAARLGVSRAALYRYEKGEVIKLDTVKRLAELLKVSPLSLLGIGVEYYSRPTGYFERVRQIEESADQILQLGGAVCYLTTTESYDTALAESLATAAAGVAGPERVAAQTTVEQVLALLSARKRAYATRRPGIIALISARAVRAFLRDGLLAAAALPTVQRLRKPERGADRDGADCVDDGDGADGLAVRAADGGGADERVCDPARAGTGRRWRSSRFARTACRCSRRGWR